MKVQFIKNKNQINPKDQIRKSQTVIKKGLFMFF